MVLSVKARILFVRSASHVIFNPEDGKAGEDFNESFVVAVKLLSGCFFVTFVILSKSNCVKLLEEIDWLFFCYIFIVSNI